MLYFPCCESGLEVSKLLVNFGFWAGETNLVDFFAIIDLIWKTNPEPFKCRQNPLINSKWHEVRFSTVATFWSIFMCIRSLEHFPAQIETNMLENWARASKWDVFTGKKVYICISVTLTICEIWNKRPPSTYSLPSFFSQVDRYLLGNMKLDWDVRMSRCPAQTKSLFGRDFACFWISCLIINRMLWNEIKMLCYSSETTVLFLLVKVDTSDL